MLQWFDIPINGVSHGILPTDTYGIIIWDILYIYVYLYVICTVCIYIYTYVYVYIYIYVYVATNLI